jgi:asparagine synthase (glutamine-hydrolysing)
VRVPFLDHVLVEWAATLPHHLRLNARGSKYVLRTALEPHLPARIVRRKKMGFAVPLASWLRGSLLGPVEGALFEPAFAGSGLFDMVAVRALIDRHRSGRRDHSRAIWALFMFAGFLHRIHEGKGPSLDDGQAVCEAAARPA